MEKKVQFLVEIKILIKKIALKIFFGYKFEEIFISNILSNTKIITLTQKDKFFS